jgi:hypothetical protein
MIAGIMYAIGGFVEALVGLRFLFRLLGADPASGFVGWIYSWSTPLVSPFAGIFGQNATVAGQGTVVASVFDWTALIALVVYGLVVGILVRLTAFGRPRQAL